ncbi:MAG TPA: amidohydrolase family protein [Phycisphaerae bacterium]|nr:amidohydrolase family protein [Phycisphaerae bacterium]
MSIPLFDVQCGFGGFQPGVREVVSADETLAEMDRLGVERALVRTTPCEMDKELVLSNAQLYDARRRHERLIPCPAVVPYCGDELPEEEAQVADAIAHGAGAVVLRPEADCWTPEEWCCGRLLSVLEARRVPVLCLTKMLPLSAVGGLAGSHAALPIIVAQTEYRTYRSLWTLLKAFDNVHLSIGSNLTIHGCIEELAAAFGPERLLFGTGWPDSEMMTAITQLTYADIPEGHKRLIGSGNLTRLMEGIRR